MYSYKYDENSCVILDKFDAEIQLMFVSSVLLCHSDIDFDLDLYEVIVGDVDDTGLILRYAQFPKPAEDLVRVIKETKERLNESEMFTVENEFRIACLEMGLTI